MKKLARFLRTNPRIAIGAALLCGMLLFWLVGTITIGTSRAVPLSGPPDQPPSARYLLGTDSAGRQLLPVLIAGIPLTLEIGLLAGGVGLLIGTLLGFSAGYFGGSVDSIIRTTADVILPIPALAVLVVIASTIHTLLSVEIMALVIASLAWMYPTRTIRAQVLSLRNRAFVEVGRFSGETHVDIIFRELMPNLLPYLAASFVGAVGAGILAGIGLEALGLGPPRVHVAVSDSAGSRPLREPAVAADGLTHKWSPYSRLGMSQRSLAAGCWTKRESPSLYSSSHWGWK